MDNFYSGDTEDLKLGAMLRTMRRYNDDAVQRDVNDMFDEILRDTRVEMSPSEKKQFFEKYIKTLQMRIHDDGQVSIDLKVKG